jgi:hypothetical protein
MSFYSTGYFCVFSNLYSLEYVQEVLEDMYCKSRYNSVDDTNMLNLDATITIFLAKSPDNEDVLPSLRQKGQDLADRYINIKSWGWVTQPRF